MQFKLKKTVNLMTYLIVCVVLIFPTSLKSQDSLLVGKEFWVAFGSQPTSMPDIATLTNGSFVICWQDNSLNVVAHIYDEIGKRIGDGIKVNSKPNTFHPEPAIAALNNGGFIICWHHFVEDEARGDLYGQLFASDGTKIGNEFFVIPSPPERLIPFRSDAISLLSGEIVVAWQVYNGDRWEYGLFAQRLTQDGDRIGEQFQINSFPYGANETEINLAPMPDSGFVATWFREWFNYGTQVLHENIAVQLFDKNGNKKVNEITINNNPLYSMVSPVVTVLKGGSFVVCWHGLQMPNQNCWAQRFDSDGNRLSEIYLINRMGDFNLNPIITPLNNGNFVICWIHSKIVQVRKGLTSGHPDIFGQQFDLEGNHIGNEFRVNDHSSLDLKHNSPSIAALNDSGFVVTWQVGLESIYAKIVTGEPFAAEEYPNLLPKEFDLYQNVPNPFNERTKIIYELPDKLSIYWVDIIMYNSIGQVVKKFHKGWQSPGRYEITWDGSNEAGNFVANGIYFYQITVNENRFYQVKKLVYLK
jgi:hypothetical protein